MESSIPAHLRCPRTRPARASEDYVPPYPAWSARMAPERTRFAMAFIGVQYRGAGQRAAAQAFVAAARAQFALRDGPGHHDLAHHVDEAGFDHLVFSAYWDHAPQYQRWADNGAVQDWWEGLAQDGAGPGYFREIFTPDATRVETIFSSPDRFEGLSQLAVGLSDDIQEHGYWGSARDRLPAAQTDALRARGEVRREPLDPAGRRVRVLAHDNVALIRSGQDWTETQGEERRLYLEEVEPVLRAGMDFLRDEGVAVGCYANRYMTQVDDALAPLQKSFGFGLWKSLETLERWSESHPTHVAIFGGFMRMVQAMEFQLKLRLYHEITVVPAQDQHYEYIGCHPATGMLRVA